MSDPVNEDGQVDVQGTDGDEIAAYDGYVGTVERSD